MRVLMIEDESKVAAFVKRGLETEGYSVEIAHDGLEGERLARKGLFDLVILDAGLPGKDGFDILRDLRKEDFKTPVLMLTARSTTREIVDGLELGADDYLTKPFAFDVLLARIRSLQRRHTHLTNTLRVADLTLDTVSHKAERASKTIELTAREYALLETFMRHVGTVLSRQQLARLVWGYDFDPGTNVVDVYVNHLRKKIDHGFKQQLLSTRRGKGYVLEASVPPSDT